MGFDRRRMRLRQKMLRLQGNGLTLDALLFGKEAAPDAEHLDARRDLIRRFRELMAEFKSQDAVKLRDYLYRAYEAYDVDRDGQSKAMSLVWDIETLKELEAEHAQAPGGDRK